MSPALDVRVVKRVHPGLTLDVAFTLGRECGVVFGRSGAGKSTLLRLIAGLTRADAGHVRVGGQTLFDAAAGVDAPLRSRRVAMVFQDDLLFPHLSAARNVRFGLKGLPRAEADRRLDEVAGLCGVRHLLDRLPPTLSGGERQRVGLARALAPRPRLLLCDEPVSALDLDARRTMVDRLRAVQEAEGLPVLYVTHSPAEAVALGRTMFLLEGGRLAAEGPPLDVLAAGRPGESVAGLEGVLNRFEAVVEGHPSGGETRLRVANGPALVVPRQALPEGSAAVVTVAAGDVLLASGPVDGLSARNVIAGEVERVLPHGDEAEVVVRTGGVTWVAALVATAVAALGLKPGRAVHIIVKARSFQVREPDRG